MIKLDCVIKENIKDHNPIAHKLPTNFRSSIHNIKN